MLIRVMAHPTVVLWYKQLMGEVDMDDQSYDMDDLDDEDLWAALDSH